MIPENPYTGAQDLTQWGDSDYNYATVASLNEAMREFPGHFSQTTHEQFVIEAALVVIQPIIESTI